MPLHLQLLTCHSLRTVHQHNSGSLEFVTANTGGGFDALGNVSEHPLKFGNFLIVFHGSIKIAKYMAICAL